MTDERPRSFWPPEPSRWRRFLCLTGCLTFAFMLGSLGAVIGLLGPSVPLTDLPGRYRYLLGEAPFLAVIVPAATLLNLALVWLWLRHYASVPPALRLEAGEVLEAFCLARCRTEPASGSTAATWEYFLVTNHRLLWAREGWLPRRFHVEPLARREQVLRITPHDPGVVRHPILASWLHATGRSRDLAVHLTDGTRFEVIDRHGLFTAELAEWLKGAGFELADPD